MKSNKSLWYKFFDERPWLAVGLLTVVGITAGVLIMLYIAPLIPPEKTLPGRQKIIMEKLDRIERKLDDLSKKSAQEL